jgi:drug/metabolite transporter (DMT)-like permease
MSTGYLAALATLFCWTISTFVLAKLTRLVEPSLLNKATLFFCTILLGIFVCIIDGIAPWQLFILPDSTKWLWLGLSGILGKSLGDYFGYGAMRILGARRRSMIGTLGPGFTWFFGLLILNEKMNWVGIAAMIITITSLLLLINSTAEKEEIKKEKFGLPVEGLLLGLAAVSLTGLAFILSKLSYVEGGHTISEFHGTWVRVIVAFAALMLVDIVRNKHTEFIKPFLFDKQKGGLLFLTILFGAILGLSFSLMAITRMNAAVAYTIFAMLPVTVILVSVIVFKKKITALSWFYSALAIAGVLALVWREALIKYF